MVGFMNNCSPLAVATWVLFSGGHAYQRGGLGDAASLGFRESTRLVERTSTSSGSHACTKCFGRLSCLGLLPGDSLGPGGFSMVDGSRGLKGLWWLGWRSGTGASL